MDKKHRSLPSTNSGEKVLDQAIDAALADSGTVDAPSEKEMDTWICRGCNCSWHNWRGQRKLTQCPNCKGSEIWDVADAPPEVTEEMLGSVYVASSWRNERQPGVVANLRRHGYEVYDFRNPSEGDNGFHWSEIDPLWQEWTPTQYRSNLTHPLAEIGFAKDMDALRNAGAVVLVNPCGRSAHLELAWALGAGKPGVILLSDGEPELMYKMATAICVSLDEVRAVLATGQKEG